MSKGLYIWCDSGANIHSNYKQFLTWEELGITEDDWDNLSEKEQEEMAKDIAFDKLDWGFDKADGDGN